VIFRFLIFLRKFRRKTDWEALPYGEPAAEEDGLARLPVP
jgi:hypothetical protein